MICEDFRQNFDIPPDVTYLNVANLAPLSRSAQSAGIKALKKRGAPWTIGVDDWFEPAEERRSLFARLVGCSAENIAFVPATSYGLAVAAANLSAMPGQKVVLIAEDYPSSVYTWRRFCSERNCEMVTVQREAGQSWTDAVIASAGDDVAVIAVPNVHWTDGALLDLPAIAERGRAIGAALVIDASQSWGALPIDLDRVRPDFVIAVGYKWLMGPFGLGYLYVADRHLEGRPIEENWLSRAGSDDFARLVEYTDAYRSGARRFDVGEKSLFELTPVANSTLRMLNDWGRDTVRRELAARVEKLVDSAERHGLGVTTGPRCEHMLGIKLPGGQLQGASEILKDAGIFVGIRGDTMRVAPHLHTDETDLARFDAALRTIAHA